MMHQTAAFRSSVLVVLGTAFAVAVAADSSLRRYELPDHGKLALTVPDDWIDNVAQPPERLPPTISFKQKIGAPFDILVTPIWPADGAIRITPEQVKKMVEDSAKHAAPQAVEKVIEVKTLNGASGSGYYFRATDKAPAPGEYKFMTQGATTAGNLIVTFTVLTNDGQADIASKALAMLTSAQHIEEKKN